MSQDFALVDVKNIGVSTPTYVTPQVPKNLADLTQTEGVFSGLLAIPLPIPAAAFAAAAYSAQLAAGGTGLLNKEWAAMKAISKSLQFKNATAVAGPNLAFDVTALRRDNQTIDIAIKATITFTTGYTRDKEDDWDPFASLYQDEVRFAIIPKDSSLLEIDPKGVSPANQLGEVNYSNEVSWGVNTGFSADGDGPSGGGGADFSWTVGSTTAKQDFNLVRDSDLDKDGIGWVSHMQNAYDEGHSGSPYNTNAPVAGLAINGVYTKWLKIPPAVARGDYDLEFLAAYKNGKPEIRDKPVVFSFSTSQRLMHVEVTHRWGLKGARMGGVVTGVPYWVHVTGEIAVDMQKGTATVKATPSGQNLQQFVTAAEAAALSAG